MQVFGLSTLTESQAQIVELLGDDGSPHGGFLRQEGDRAQYYISVEPARLHDRGEYYFAFRRFAQTFLSQPSSRDTEAAAHLRIFLQEQQITDVALGHGPETLPQAFVDRPLPPLKVITINAEWFVTHWANPTNPEARLHALADWIRAQDADVIVLQEIMNDWFAKLLPLLPSMHGDAFAYGSLFPNSEIKIVSRHRIVQANMYPQSWASSLAKYCYIGEALETHRGFGIALIDFHGTYVAVATLHSTVVDHEAYPTEDRHLSPQVSHLRDADPVTPERIMTYLDMWTYFQPLLNRHPVIVAGDFNVNPVHRDLSIWHHIGMRNTLLDSHNSGVTDYTRPNRGMSCHDPHAFETFSTCNRRVAAADGGNLGLLDFIFVNGQVRNLYTYIEKTTDAFSDHWAVVGKFRIQPGTDRSTLRQAYYPKVAPPIPETEIDRLITYFQNVHLNLFCVQNSRAQILLQRENTLGQLRYFKSLYE